MSMPKAVKYGLISLAVLVIVVIACGAALMAWIKSNEPEWQHMKQSAQLEGQRYGEEHSAQECVQLAQEKIVACAPKNAFAQSECETGAYLFEDACLLNAGKGEDDCAPFDLSQKGLLAGNKDVKRVCAELDDEHPKACVKARLRLRAFCVRAPQKS